MYALELGSLDNTLAVLERNKRMLKPILILVKPSRPGLLLTRSSIVALLDTGVMSITLVSAHDQ